MTPPRSYWYLTESWECVLCGRTHTYRERQYTPRPEDWLARNKRHDDACSEHFL